jgi:CRISPR system Cascade subunit CasE
VTTWLSVLTPDRRRPDVASDLDDINRFHQRIMGMYPQGLGASPRASAGVLFRVDEDSKGLVVLIQSNIQPDPQQLPGGYGACTSRPLDPLLGALRPGLPVRYRLTANATRKLGHNTQAGKPLTVVPLHGHEAEEWWIRKAAESGLEARIIQVTGLDPARGQRAPQRNRPQHLRHARTRFDGTAVITDPERLRTALTAGIGRAKSYGCGLLTAAPAR